MARFCYPSHGSINRRMIIQASLGIKASPVSKITKSKRAGSMAQVLKVLA
jgi:hypothetical protein